MVNDRLIRLNPKDKLVKSAKKEFGVTSDFREGGYFLDDGKILDLSGKNIGGPSGSRSLDHREVSRAIDTESKGIAGGDAMDFFERQAKAIRYSLIGSDQGSPDVNISLNTFQTPSNIQEVRMRNVITVCKRLATKTPCRLIYDVFFDDGARCKSGFVDNASQRDVNKVLDDLNKCKIEDKKISKKRR